MSYVSSMNYLPNEVWCLNIDEICSNNFLYIDIYDFSLKPEVGLEDIFYGYNMLKEGLILLYYTEVFMKKKQLQYLLILF